MFMICKVPISKSHYSKSTRCTVRDAEDKHGLALSQPSAILTRDVFTYLHLQFDL